MSLFKRGKIIESLSYRPVSLTSIIGNIFGRIIKKMICAYLGEKEAVIFKSQHGFIKVYLN